MKALQSLVKNPKFSKLAENIANNPNIKKLAENVNVDDIKNKLGNPADLAKSFNDPSKLLGQVTGSLNSTSSSETPKTIVYSEDELKKIKEIIYEVIKEKIPPSLIADKVGAFVSKLATNKDNITEVKVAMMNIIFNDINILTANKQLKNTFIVKLLTYPDIITIVNSIPLDKNYVSILKEKLLPMTSFSGGATDDKTKDLFYEKMCRLMDVDISDNDVMELFVKNASDFFKRESPEKTRLFQKMAGQIGVFIDQIFQSIEFRDPAFRKYLFYGLLDGDAEGVIIVGFSNSETTGQKNADRIKLAFQKELDVKQNNITGGRRNQRKRKTIRKHKRRNLRLKTRRN